MAADPLTKSISASEWMSDQQPEEVGMACDRCGGEPDADLTRYSSSEGEDEVLAFSLCPSCSYGLNMYLRAYVANRELALR